MKRNILHVGAVFLMALFNFSSMAQIGSDGFYRACNADNNGTEYISIANDFFNFSTVISNGAGATAVTGIGLPYAINSTKMFLRNDIHLINNQSQIISPAEVIYFDKKNSNASNHDYNLIAQGVMPSTENGVHIDPIIMQVGNGLIRIDLTSIQPHAVVPGKSVQARIIYYSPR